MLEQTSPHPIRVIAAVIRRGPNLLVCQRPIEKRHGGLWEFPGGKCEPGESDTDTARRELQEELGVRVTGIGRQLFAILDPGSPYLIAFIEVEIEGTPKCLEHSALTWDIPEALSALPLAPSDRRFVEHLLARHP